MGNKVDFINYLCHKIGSLAFLFKIYFRRVLDKEFFFEYIAKFNGL